MPKIDIFQISPERVLGDVMSCLESKFDKKIPMGSVPNCWKEIANGYPIRWFKCKLKPPKNGAFRKSKFSQWRSDRWLMRLGVLGGQMTGLNDGTIFWGGGGCDTLKGVPGAVKKIAFFSTFVTPWRVLWIHWFYQESVHRCSLGCSTYLSVDFWIHDWLAVCWAVKWQFLRCHKISHVFLTPQNFRILSHKLA